MVRIILFIVAFSISLMASAQVNKETRVLEGTYSRIEALKGVNVSLHQCDTDELEIVTEGCSTTDVDTYIKKGTLFIKMKKITKGSAVQVFVKLKDVESLYIHGGASLSTECVFQRKGALQLDVAATCEVEMELDVDELTVSANSCQISLSGDARKQTVEVKGTVGEMKYDAISLKSEDVEIYSSEAESDVYFTNSLKAECVSGTITYKGEESGVHEKIVRSGGKIEKL